MYHTLVYRMIPDESSLQSATIRLNKSRMSPSSTVAAESKLLPNKSAVLSCVLPPLTTRGGFAAQLRGASRIVVLGGAPNGF